MPSRRGSGAGLPARNSSNRNGGYRATVIGLLVISVIAPLMFLAGRTGNFITTRHSQTVEDLSDAIRTEEVKRRSALEQIESLFPKEVLDVITTRTEEAGPLNLNIVGRKDLSSSWVREEGVDVSRKASNSYQEPVTVVEGRFSAEGSSKDKEGEDTDAEQGEGEKVEAGIRESFNMNFQTEGVQAGGVKTVENLTDITRQGAADLVGTSGVLLSDGGATQGTTPSKVDEAAMKARKQLRLHRHEKRLTELIQQDEQQAKKLEAEVIEKSKEVDGGVIGKFSAWRRDSDSENQDALVRLMRDQLIMARAYANIAQAQNHSGLVRDLKLRIKEHQIAVGDANIDAELPRGAAEKMKVMGQLLTKARDRHYDSGTMVKKLRAMLQQSEEQARILKKQSTFLSQLAAKTVPKGLHCLSMRLTVEYHTLPMDQRDFSYQERLEDPSLYHYALFSDNILAAGVVVNSTVFNAKEPEKHVFHVVTDKLNYGAMKMWFLANPPGTATIQVENVDDFKWLNASYCPVLRQLESAAMKEYYFKADHPTTLAAGTSNLKYRNPKYLSMLNHLRFYLPEVFPTLDKILFLDDDIVVQKDLTPLWDIDLHGNVNGAVETCGASFHRFDKYLNFSNPLISRHFDPNACGWAYGMNVFDLKEWKKRDITGIYHRWQSLNEDRVLWKLGTLPPGLITFYNLTHALDKSWHVLGLGYNPTVEESEIDLAAVIHYNGNMKPWLEIGMTKFKPYWSKFVKFNHPYLQQCNIND